MRMGFLVDRLLVALLLFGFTIRKACNLVIFVPVYKFAFIGYIACIYKNSKDPSILHIPCRI